MEFNINEYENIEKLQPQDIRSKGSFGDVIYDNEFSQNRRLSKTSLKDDVLKRDSSENLRVDQSFPPMKMMDLQPIDPYDKSKNVEEKDTLILDRNDLIGVYSFIAKYNGIIMCAF